MLATLTGQVLKVQILHRDKIKQDENNVALSVSLIGTFKYRIKSNTD